MMATILNSANLNSTILDTAISVFPLKLTHTCWDWFPPFAQINFTHSFWLNLMMAAIFNSAMLDSATTILDLDTLLSSLRFAQKHSHSTLTLTETNSIWLKLIHSHLTWWRQPFWILPSWIQPFYTKKLHWFILTQLDDGSHLHLAILDSAILVFSSETHSHLPTLIPTICTKKTSLIHSDSTWWWQPSWNPVMLDSDTAILDSDTLLTSLRFTQKHSHSNLTLNQTNSIWLKLIPSHITWWWQPSWILPSRIHPFCTKLWLKLIQSDSNSFIVIQLDDGNHLEFCHLGFSHFAKNKLHSFILTQLDDGSHL